MRCILGFDHISNLYTRLCFCIELYFNTCCRLIIEMIFKTKQDLGWTRYTPRLIYLLLLCYVCYDVSSNLYTLRLIPMFPPSVGV
ncbi:hypothetical protein Hanom_Chr13g01238711 [Helianthus anomalus]